MRQSLTKIPDGKFQGMRLGNLCGESAEGRRTFRVLSAHDLLDKTKQNRDDDSGLKRLTKDDEENGHGEDGHLELELAGWLRLGQHTS